MKYAALLLLTISVALNCPGQTYTQMEDIMFSCFWDFYADNRMAPQACGRGYTGVASEGELVSAVINPASMANIAGWQAFAGYAYKSNLPWLRGFVGGMELRTLHPCGMLSVGRSINDKIQIGCFIYETKSYRLDEGTFEHVDEYGNVIGTFSSKEDVRKTSLYLPVSLKVGDQAQIGFGLEINRCRRNKNIGLYKGEASFWEITPRIGTILKANQVLSFGLAYRYGMDYAFTEKGSYSGGTTVPISDTSWPSSYSNYNEMEWPLHHHEPSTIILGIEYRSPGTPISFMADLGHVFIPDILRSLKDRNDLHLGLEYRKGDVDYRVGYFTVRDYRVRSQYLNPSDNSQYFLTCGFSRYFGFWGLTLSLMDSHLLSPGEWKTTVVNGGVSYLF